MKWNHKTIFTHSERFTDVPYPWGTPVKLRKYTAPQGIDASWTFVNSGNSGAYREKEEIIWASQYQHDKYRKQD